MSSPISSLGERVSGAASPTDSATDSPGVSPAASPNNIPDTNKYKKNMLWRYLNDVTEAHQNLSTSGNKSGDGDSSTVSDQEYDTLNVGQELVYPPQSASLSPETTVGADTTWDTVTSEMIPASNNITISFTNTPIDKTLVPVISPPSRNDMGVDKVKRQLNKGHMKNNGSNGHGGLANNYGGTGTGQVYTVVHHPGSQQNSFSSSMSNISVGAGPGNGYQELPVSSDQASNHPSASMASVTTVSAPTIFSPPIFRPLSVLPLGSAYPFLQTPINAYPFLQAPLNNLPQLPHTFLHLIPPDSSK